jgi:membrane associated rhomboid family serine protease
MSKSPNRLLGIAFGILFVVAGVYGFFITSSTDFLSTTGPKLLELFATNPLHSLSYVVLGAALLIAGLSGPLAARGANTIIGVVFLLVGVVGLFLVGGGNPLNILALNGADNVLHFATAVVLLVVGVGADRTVRAPKTA